MKIKHRNIIFLVLMSFFIFSSNVLAEVTCDDACQSWDHARFSSREDCKKYLCPNNEEYIDENCKSVCNNSGGPTRETAKNCLLYICKVPEDEVEQNLSLCPGTPYESYSECVDNEVKPNDPTSAQSAADRYCRDQCSDDTDIDSNIGQKVRPTQISDCEYNSYDECMDEEKDESKCLSCKIYQGNYVSCGNIKQIPAPLPELSRLFVTLIQIGVPVLLIILGMLDFTRAVASDNAENIDKAKSKFIKRLIAGVAVFFVFAIVKFVMNNIVSDDSSGAMQCASCFINDSSKCK